MLALADTAIRGRRIVVVGFGTSGTAAARLCVRKGAAEVVLNDQRAAQDLGEERMVALVKEGIRLDLGGHRPETFADADLVVMSPGVPTLHAVEGARARGVLVVGEMEIASWWVEAPVIAVTGTNGKSTVTTLVGEMLKTAGYDTFVGGNLGDPLSNAVGTPAAGEVGRVVLEASSYQLEGISEFHPHVAVWLNLTPDHMDRYASFAEYGAAKARIYGNQTRTDHAVVPADDPLMLAFARGGSAMVHTYGQGGEVRIDGDAIVDLHGARFPLSELLMRGAHNVGNAMAAVLAAELAGAPSDATFAAVGAFAGLAHRMQYVLEDDGVVYFDDSKATNVGAAVTAIQSIDRPVVLIAGGRDKGGSYAPLVELLRGRARAVVLLGEAAQDIRAAIGDSVPSVLAENMLEAVRVARRIAVPGDCVLLAPACSSLDMFENYAARGRVFSAAVRNLAGTPRATGQP